MSNSLSLGDLTPQPHAYTHDDVVNAICEKDPDDDQKWLMDVFEPFLGRSPSTHEVSRFCGNRVESKREQILSNLIATRHERFDFYSPLLIGWNPNEVTTNEWLGRARQMHLNHETAPYIPPNVIYSFTADDQTGRLRVTDDSEIEPELRTYLTNELNSIYRALVNEAPANVQRSIWEPENAVQNGVMQTTINSYRNSAVRELTTRVQRMSAAQERAIASETDAMGPIDDQTENEASQAEATLRAMWARRIRDAAETARNDADAAAMTEAQDHVRVTGRETIRRNVSRIRTFESDAEIVEKPKHSQELPEEVERMFEFDD